MLYFCGISAPAMRYTHLFFDLDHTLWDFEKNAKDAMKDLYELLQLKAKGIEDFDIFLQKYLQHNEAIWRKYHRGEITAQDLKWKRMHRTLVDFKIGDEQLAKKMAEEFLNILPEKKAVFDNCFETLEYLQSKNYQMHLITNGFEVTQQRKLNASGLNKYFGKMITSEATGFVKPHKEIFAYAVSITGAALAKCLMLGDNVEADIMGAAAIGMHTVYINHTSQLPATMATYTVTNLAALRQLL
jgi:putative hydrolase of the HAD superfamily